MSPARGLLSGLLLVIATGCGGDTPEAVPGLSPDEALAIVQGHARESLTLWGTGATLSPVSDQASAVWCSDQSTPPEGTPVLVEATYAIRDMEPRPGSAASRDEVADAFEGHWANQGWSEAYRLKTGKGRVIAMERDEYVLKLTLDAKNAITVSTPCVEGEPRTIPISDITH